MLAAYTRGARAIQPLDPSSEPVLDRDIVWIDMKEPSREEIRFVERAIGIEMPTPEEMREIEASARVYEERSAVFLTATVLVHADSPPPDTTEVTFILKGDVLVTLRYADPQPFRTVSGRLDRTAGTPTTAHGTFFWLIDQIIARAADVLERASQDIDTLSSKIFAAARPQEGDDKIDLVEAIARIGRDGDTTSKVRESLHTLQRVLIAISATEMLPASAKKEARVRAKALNRDVHSLMEHTGFVTANVNLLLDATLGMINIEQTNIIKIFSVLAIVFLPPTLIASIYGMNFQFMPEFHWKLGYPLALFLMIAAALLPYLYFKRRGWL
jgi:magnesium transporter